MSEFDVLECLRQLHSDYIEGSVDIEFVVNEFDKLTHVVGTGREVEPALRKLVNELEVIRFGRLPQNQPAAVDAVFARAQVVFESLL